MAVDELGSMETTDTEGMCLDRYKMFLKQYNEWVAANKDRLEKESYKVFRIRQKFSLRSFRNSIHCFIRLKFR